MACHPVAVAPSPMTASSSSAIQASRGGIPGITSSAFSTAASAATTQASGVEGSGGSPAAGKLHDSDETRHAELAAARSSLLDSLDLCLGLHSLDSLLAKEWNPAVFDELVLLRLLDRAHGLCNTATATNAVPLAAWGVSASTKSPSEAAADVLTRLSELLILRLSEGPEALSPEGAVRALRTLAVMRFNPAGDYKGLMTMADFYRVSVLPGLKAAQAADPSLAARMSQLLIDLFFAFSRLFDLAARRERDAQAQLQAAQAAVEEAAAQRAADEEASGGAGLPASAAVPPWQRDPAELLGGVQGHQQLYFDLARALHEPGMLSNVPTKSLGTLATALATAHFPHQVAHSLATQTLLRLQGGAAGNAAALAGIRTDASPTGNDAVATSTLSNILSCLAKLGFEHETLCDATANWMHQRLGGAGATGGGVVGNVEPHHIVDIAVAFARLKYDNMDYMNRAAAVLQRKVSLAAPNSVAMMTWALANSKSGRSEDMNTLLEALASRMVSLHRYTMAAPGRAARASGSAPAPESSSGSSSMLVVPRHLACMALALAKLQKHRRQLRTQQLRFLDAVVEDVVTRAESYQARQLCSILYAFVLFDSKRPELFDSACSVLERRLRAQARQAPGAPPLPPSFAFGPHNYSDLAFSVALSGFPAKYPGLMELLADRVAETAQSQGMACLVRTAQAYAVADPAPYTAKVFNAVAEAIQPRLSDLGPTFLALLVDAFAEVQQPVTPEFWKGCMDAAGLKMPYMERPREDMHSAVARLAAGFRRHPASQAFPECRNHYVPRMLEEIVNSYQTAPEAAA